MSAARTLTIGSGLQLPLEFATQTSALLGKRGVGKTHGAVVLAEELLDAGIPVVILDPIGVWWGLRSSADGKSAGHRILVAGGEHGDLPLAAEHGPLLARWVVEKRAGLVVDMGEFSKSDQARFVAEFLEDLYRKNREPLHVIMDEADAFAPQRLHPGAQRCFGAVDQVVRRGRARGLGVTLVTQRSAAINKDVLSQVEVLVAFRTLAPQDRAALEAWIDVHADRDEAKRVLTSLASLAVGEAWVWSPAWLGTLARVRIRRRRTFDSSATPKVGATRVTPKAIAKVDVDVLRGELDALVKKAEAEDPRRLRARIAELERAKASPAAANPAAVSALREQLADAKRRLARVDRLFDRIGAVGTQLEKAAAQLEAIAGELTAATKPGTGADLDGDRTPPTLTPRNPVGRAAIPFPRVLAEQSGLIPARPRATGNGDAGVLGKAERAVLGVLAQHPDGCALGRLALIAGYAAGGGGFLNALSRLRQAGLLEGANSGTLRITPAGAAALGDDWTPLPSGDALVRYWLEHRALGKAERAILGQLARVGPRAGVTLDALAELTGYAPGGGGFLNALSRLRTIGLIEGRNSDSLRASAHLFD